MVHKYLFSSDMRKLLMTFLFVVTPEFKQKLLMKCLTLERLAEEQALLKTEMKSYLLYYVSTIVPLLKKKISSYEDKTCFITTISYMNRICVTQEKYTHYSLS